MAVSVRVSELNPQVTIVVLSGRLDLEAVEQDAPLVQQAVSECDAGVIFDLGGVEFISSSGFRLLLSAYQETHGAGKTLALTHTQPAVYKIFKVAALDSRFSFFDNEASAIEALWQ